MSSSSDANIKSYFQPTGEFKGKRKTETDTSNMSKPESAASKVAPKSQTKVSHKRLLSTSPPAPAPKKSNTDTIPDAKQHNHLAYNDLSKDWMDARCTKDQGPESADAETLSFTYHIGDMFEDAPENCLLIHACNTQGHWGAGIAKAFKQKYPKAYTAHNKFCANEHSKTQPVPTGSAQLLAPVDSGSQHWIGCLFTSGKYGKAKDKPDAIVKSTTASMNMLLELVRMADGKVSEIRMCKINSGKFGVPWEKTEEALKSIVLQEGWREKIEIWEP
jgi:ADP-ribose 1''-phosphate phosphatase